MDTILAFTYWYSKHGRDLPWRYETDAYSVWLSETIMQQTRIAQGLKYYLDFKKKYPNVHDLARAPLDEVLKLWQGLGYYTRARNLHATAKLIVEQYGGVFPDTYEGLRKLKGVGDYTAAAIASIVYKIPVAVVDGNVLRVLARLFGVFTPIDSSAGKKEIAALAQQLLDKEHPDTHNQAVMDFGALVCTPQKAQCATCPFSDKCYAYRNNCVYQLPVKTKKTKIRIRYFNYLMIRCGNNTFIRQRTADDIWHMLYEFPCIAGDTELLPEQLCETSEWQHLFNKEEIQVRSVSVLQKSQLSHQTIWCRFYIIYMRTPSEMLLKKYEKINIHDFEKYSIPRPIEKYTVSAEAVKNFFEAVL